MALVHAYVPPERFVAGTVGDPGDRTFFLQARSGARITSVSLEKQQVVVLAERIDQLLDDLLSDPSNQSVVPAVAAHHLEDSAPLEQPIVDEFRVGTMTLSWDTEDISVVVEVFSLQEDFDDNSDPSATDEALARELREELAADVNDDLSEEMAEELAEALAEVLGDDGDFDEMLLVRMTAAQARSFASRARRVVGAGRPACPFCGNPMDPSGHLCVRANGFRRRLS